MYLKGSKNRSVGELSPHKLPDRSDRSISDRSAYTLPPTPRGALPYDLAAVPPCFSRDGSLSSGRQLTDFGDLPASGRPSGEIQTALAK